jgi:hypothetical protein
MESQWIPETLKNNFRGQNSMACGALYIVRNLLECKCLKWVHIAHLDIWNTSYDYWPKKIGNQPNLLGCKGRATYCWKALNKSYNFVLDRILIRGLLAKLRGSKVAEVPSGAISRLPFGSPRREKPFGCRLRGQPQSIP